MDDRDKEKIIAAKISALMSEADTIFDKEYLRNAFLKKDLFEERLNPFMHKLSPEITSLPLKGQVKYHLDFWIEDIEIKIDKASRIRSLSEIGRIFLAGRKKLKARLLEIKSDLLTRESTAIVYQVSEETTPVLSFNTIFVSEHWKPYIDALWQVDGPVINEKYEFIGAKKHKGVIASWIKELQFKGIIYRKYTRQELVQVLNQEIKDLGLGKDGKTLDNTSLVYNNEYKMKLLRIVKKTT